METRQHKNKQEVGYDATNELMWVATIWQVEILWSSIGNYW